MNLQQTKETILRWVNSCETSEQLYLLEEAAAGFIIGRLYPEATELDQEIAMSEIEEATRVRNLVIASKQPVEYPTLELNKHINDSKPHS